MMQRKTLKEKLQPYNEMWDYLKKLPFTPSVEKSLQSLNEQIFQITALHVPSWIVILANFKVPFNVNNDEEVFEIQTSYLISFLYKNDYSKTISPYSMAWAYCKNSQDENDIIFEGAKRYVHEQLDLLWKNI